MIVKEILKRVLMSASSVLHNNHGSKILYYHDVFRTINYRALDADIHMGTPLDLFKCHIDVIRNEGYEIVREITEPRGQVSIMFDDGFRGIYECRDYFYDNKILPTIFLPAGFIGDTDKGLLSYEEILDLQSHGFKFECHGWNHVALDTVSDSDLDKELIESKAFLSQKLGKNVDSICMPLGFFTNHVLERIREVGYEKIYSCIPGNLSDNPFGLLTRNLCQYATPEEVRLILRGGNALLQRRYMKMHCHG